MKNKTIEDILSKNKKYRDMNPKQKEVAIETFNQIKLECIELNMDIILDIIIKEERET